MKIDFVVSWVDGSDQLWQAERKKYSAKAYEDGGPGLYKDLGLFKYWFRTIEKYAPWVNNIFLITFGHVPNWLNINNSKLKIIKHDEYIPKKFLPTFNSNVIEINMHRIKELSEHFVYFCDDMFLNKPISPDFFFKDNLPCDYIELTNFTEDKLTLYGKIISNDTYNIAKTFDFRKVIELNYDKIINELYTNDINQNNQIEIKSEYFRGIKLHHNPTAYLKSTFLDIWDTLPGLMEKTSLNRFRNFNDISHHMFRCWQLMSGEFIPTSPWERNAFYDILNDNKIAVDAILSQKPACICLNELQETEPSKIANIVNAYEAICPYKSSFEK